MYVFIQEDEILAMLTRTSISNLILIPVPHITFSPIHAILVPHSILHQTYATLWTGNVLDPADLLILVCVLQNIAQQVEERHEFIGNWLYCLRDVRKSAPAAVKPKSRNDYPDEGKPPKKANHGRQSKAAGPTGTRPEGASQSAVDQDTSLPTTLNLGRDLRKLSPVDCSSFIQNGASGVEYQMSSQECFSNLYVFWKTDATDASQENV